MRFPGKFNIEGESDNIIIKLLVRFLPYWPLFLGLMAVSLSCALLYLRYANPVYESSASVLIKDEHQGLADAKLFSSLNLKESRKIMENEIEVLGSKTLMKDVVTKLSLYAPVYLEGNVSQAPAYTTSPIKISLRDPESLIEEEKIPFTYDPVEKRVILGNQRFPLNAWLNLKWGTVKFTVNDRATAPSPSSHYYFSLISVRKVASKILRDLNVLPATKKSTVIGLRLQSEVPKMGEDIINELIKSYNHEALTAKNTQASNTLSFVENRLHFFVRELDSVEIAVEQFKTKNGIVNIDQQGNRIMGNAELNDRRVTDIDGQLAILNQVERYMNTSVSRENTFEDFSTIPQTRATPNDNVPSPVNAIDNKDLADAKQRLNDVNTQLAVLKAAPPIDKYYNMRIIRLQNEMNALKTSSDKQDAQARLAANQVVMTALQKRALSGEDNVDDIPRRQTELVQARVDLEEEISFLSGRKQSPVAAPVLSRRVIKQPFSGPGRIQALPSTNGLQDPSLTGLLERYYDLQNDYESKRKTTPENNPIMVSLQDQIDKIQGAVIQNIRSQRSNLSAGRENLAMRSENYNALLKDIPQNERMLKGIGRTQETKNDIYTFLLQKREENALLLASDISDNKLLDYAETSPFPVAPQRSLIFMIAVASAMGLGVFIVSAKKSINPKLESKSQLVDILQLPVIAEINQSKGKAPLLSDKNEDLVISEQFRQLRTSLSFMGILPEKKFILITSSTPGEGKSFVAANLAISLAMTEKKTLLVEMDLHKAKLAELLETKNDKGLSEYLTGAASLDEIIKESSANPGLFLVGAGATPENPSELILTERMKTFFAEVGKRFDYVLMKSAPVSQMTDAFVLSRVADTTIFVIRQGHTPIAAIKELESGNMFNTLVHASIVLNGVKESALEDRLN